MAKQTHVEFFKNLEERGAEVIDTLRSLVSSCGYPIYTSMDIRDAGWKIAVVDVNLFPAGFNNLTPADRSRGAQKMREFFSAKLMVSAPWTITVVPEAHTNNAGYLENLTGILSLLKEAGCNPQLLWPGTPLPKPWTLKTASGAELVYLPRDEALKNSQALLLNHDLSGGIPAAIQGVALPTFPSTKLGWYRRRKSTHQEIVEALLRKIEKNVDWFDPWFLSARTHMMSHVDFNSDAALVTVAEEAERQLKILRTEYKERAIPESPRLFIKNDAGTYGMGVFSVKSGDDIREASHKLRQKMRKGKESVPISQIIIQEAVPTAMIYEAAPRKVVAGEPVVYMINGLPIGGFIRLHENLGPDSMWENLNQPGSKLEPLECPRSPGQPHRPFAKIRRSNPCEQLGSTQVYGVLARLHAVAAGLEDCPST